MSWLHFYLKGGHPDPERIWAILNIPSPIDVQTLRSFLGLINPNLSIVMAADAPNYGVGAVILHIFPDGSGETLAHALRSLTPAEKNNGLIEKEALAFAYRVKNGHHFTLLTNYKPASSIFRFKKGIPTCLANRLQHWTIILTAQANGLSRSIGNQQTPMKETFISRTFLKKDV